MTVLHLSTYILGFYETWDPRKNESKTAKHTEHTDKGQTRQTRTPWTGDWRWTCETFSSCLRQDPGLDNRIKPSQSRPAFLKVRMRVKKSTRNDNSFGLKFSTQKWYVCRMTFSEKVVCIVRTYISVTKNWPKFRVESAFAMWLFKESGT